MGKYKGLVLVLSVSFFTLLSLFRPGQTKADSLTPQSDQTHNEEVDQLTLENELLGVSTDDAKEQQRLARREALRAQSEEALARGMLVKTKAKRRQVELTSKSNIDRDLKIQRSSQRARDFYNKKMASLENEISALEVKAQKARAEARALRAQAVSSRTEYIKLKSKRNQLAGALIKNNKL